MAEQQGQEWHVEDGWLISPGWPRLMARQGYANVTAPQIDRQWIQEVADKLNAAETALTNHDRLVQALEKYGTHSRDCAISQRYVMHPIAAQTMQDVLGSAKCTCGWSAALDALKEKP